jgi:hypothetical protein
LELLSKDRASGELRKIRKPHMKQLQKIGPLTHRELQKRHEIAFETLDDDGITSESLGDRSKSPSSLRANVVHYLTERLLFGCGGVLSSNAVNQVLILHKCLKLCHGIVQGFIREGVWRTEPLNKRIDEGVIDYVAGSGARSKTIELRREYVERLLGRLAHSHK